MMAAHQTPCVLTCTTLCSVPLNPLPFAVLAAVVIGFVMGKLASPGPLDSSTPQPGSARNGNPSRVGSEAGSLLVDAGTQAEGSDRWFTQSKPALVDAAGTSGIQVSRHPVIELPESQLSTAQSMDGVDHITSLCANEDYAVTNILTIPRRSPSLSGSVGSRSSRNAVLLKLSTPTSHNVTPRDNDAQTPSVCGDDYTTPWTGRKMIGLYPVSIPGSLSASETDSPQAYKRSLVDEPLFEAYENSNTDNNLDVDVTLPAASWMCGGDALSKRLECGLTWLDSVQASLEDLYGEVWVASVHPEDIVKSKQAIFAAMSVRGSFQVEYRLQITTGHFRWVLDLGKPRFSHNSQRFLGYVGWRIDIQESKKIEEDYEKYWSLPHEILVKASADGHTFEDVSPSFPHMLGYTMEEFRKFDWREMLHVDDVEYTVNQFKKVSQGQPLVNLVNRYRCNPNAKIEGPSHVDASGTYKWINWTANFLFGAGRDISAEKQAQLELQRSQAELRRITDAIPGGVFQYRVDDDGVQTFPFISKGAMHMYSTENADGGTPKSDQTSPNSEDLQHESNHYGFHNQEDGEEKRRLTVHPDDWPRLKEAMRQASQSGTPLDFDYRLVRGAEVRWVRVHAVPLARKESGLQDWCGITWDMTEQHLTEDALRAERDNAEKSSQAKAAFLANMSHEIRTPMNAVIGMGALLLETELTDEQRDYVSTIRSSGEALLGVINDILDFSKIEAGKMELEVATFDLCDCVEDSIDLITPQAASKGLEVTYTISEMVPAKVNGDVGRLRQILVNLLSNAVKFTPKGSVSIGVDGQRVEPITEPQSEEVNQRADNSSETSIVRKCASSNALMWKIHVTVKDTGIGIPESRKHTLFQAFSQVDASTTRRYGGTGLGLAICARLCSLLGGRIWVESVESVGSAFHFTFLAEEVASAKNLAVTCLQKSRVIIISRSSSTQTMCSRFLKSWHMRPVSAVTGDEALRVLRSTVEGPTSSSTDTLQDQFDVVIVDSAMLEDGDPQLLECLTKANEAQPKIPVILLTPFGRRAQDYAREHSQFDFLAFVTKPVKASVLLNTLMSVLVKDSDGNSDLEKNVEGNLQSRETMRRHAHQGSYSTPTMDPELGQQHPLRILIAEDNVINQKVLMRLLLRHGYCADVVANGLEAVDAALRQRYDLILMDCFMPEMDGLAATRKIKQKVKPCPIIVAVTAAALEDERQACLHAGMHMYISKPIQAEQLRFALNKCWEVKEQGLAPESLQDEGFRMKRKREMA